MDYKKYDIDGIIKFINSKPDLDPNSYDGSYELIQEIIRSYSRMSNMDVINYLDLNCVYLSVIVSSKCGIESKKNSIKNSNLPNEEKERLVKVADKVWDKTVRGEYTHLEDGPHVIGLFGTGFLSFKRTTTSEDAHDFIQMCVDILDLTNDEEIFNRAEELLKNDVRGLKAASASIMLHCLKPTVFPILNGHMGNSNTYAALGIELKKCNDLKTYISNCRKIKKFRDEHFSFLNYRVMDLDQSDLDQFVIESTSNRININELKRAIIGYKVDFKRVVEEENYKWEAVKCFQDNFDLNASDFSTMIVKAFSKCENLLTRAHYFPVGVVKEIAQYDPIYAREMFSNLYNESIPVLDRINQFNEAAEIYYQFKENNKLNTYQDASAISVYLFLKYPDKYYIYMSKKFERVAKQLQFGDIPKSGSLERVDSYFDLANQIWEYCKTDNELITLNQSRIDDNCYKDPSNHILAEDIIYYINRECIEDNTNLMNKEKVSDMNDSNRDKNLILYGPPGTGKTYNSLLYAVSICDDKSIEEIQAEDYSYVVKRFNTLKKDGRIAFTTFHQSYGYEEFIEGIKPVVDDSEDEVGDVRYSIEAGIFKEFCEHASLPLKPANGEVDYGLNKNPVIWKVSLAGTGDNPTRTECLNNDHIRIGWDKYGEVITDDTEFTNGGKVVLNSFINKMQIGDIVLSCYSASSIDAIGVVTGDYEWHPEYPSHKRLRTVHWLVKNIDYSIREMNGNTSMTLATVYKMKLTLADVFKIISDVGGSDSTSTQIDDRPYVFIIDEINRGNISKIFGELITLIEPSKRIGQTEELKVELPYSKKQFGVPDNVYILGTMNTADRSIALMDTALRRRFQFVEMMPDSEVLKDIVVEQDGETINIAEMLKIINIRIEYLYDREHTIGHAYFMPLLNNPTMDKLAEIFDKNIIPLLKEYFYEDYGKIQMILGDNKKSSDDLKFVKETKLISKDIFNGDTSELDLPEQVYSIQKEALYNIRSYKEISKDL